MKRVISITASAVLFLSVFRSGSSELKKLPGPDLLTKQYETAWASIMQHNISHWLRDARFGFYNNPGIRCYSAACCNVERILNSAYFRPESGKSLDYQQKYGKPS